MPTPILSQHEIAPKIFEMTLHAPDVARAARPGQFAIAMADAEGERIPLTLADWDATQGTVTLVIMAVGTSTRKLCALQGGDSLYAFASPLGQPSELENFGHVVLVAGGVGAAPVYPIAKALHAMGQKVTVIQGAREAGLLFWESQLTAVSSRHIVVTDDGSRGEKGLVTTPLARILETEKDVRCVYAIGPAPMMRACSETTRPFGVHTIVSLNTVMIDGTGMCGGCRVNVGGTAKFTCVDGPEFDGHQVEWASVIHRQKAFHHEERCSLDRYLDPAQR